jgi:AAA domain
VYDVARGREQSRGGASQENHEEVKFVVTLLNRLFHKFTADEIGSVAVITPYKAQVALSRAHRPTLLRARLHYLIARVSCRRQVAHMLMSTD